MVEGNLIDRNLVGVIACGGMVLVTTPLLIALVAGEIAIEKSFLVSAEAVRAEAASGSLVGWLRIEPASCG